VNAGGVGVGAGAGVGVIGGGEVGSGCGWQPTSSTSGNAASMITMHGLTFFPICAPPYWLSPQISNLN